MMPSLRSSVRVRRIDYQQRAELHHLHATCVLEASSSQSPSLVADLAAHKVAAQLLAMSVVDRDGQSLWSADEWEQFAVESPMDFSGLCLTALELSDRLSLAPLDATMQTFGAAVGMVH